MANVHIPKYAGAAWLEKARTYWKGHKEPMSDLARDVADMLGQVYGGLYHMDDSSLMRAEWHNDHRISVVVYDGGANLGTYDGSALATLVILCHLLNVKLLIEAASPRHVRLTFIRVGKWGYARESHPNLDDAIRRCQSHLSAILSERQAQGEAQHV